ncbi:uncharacterized protein EV422DRAFT_543689 [Fimicolochytrium jonesii]|uniref:uncharacterized protein n=1 Tax=Fimicolochytrium jonesii TaxID=1396493 RepID=UPI0022FE6071|nr:uncharacterized protein EV422DRAFT_543689 [Fimicolochytrium jonesii]KAI8816950.1 hypothetical protein EV422DRAFT_543689 [Fimicolochytrium jonesii]
MSSQQPSHFHSSSSSYNPNNDNMNDPRGTPSRHSRYRAVCCCCIPVRLGAGLLSAFMIVSSVGVIIVSVVKRDAWSYPNWAHISTIGADTFLAGAGLVALTGLLFSLKSPLTSWLRFHTLILLISFARSLAQPLTMLLRRSTLLALCQQRTPPALPGGSQPTCEATVIIAIVVAFVSGVVSVAGTYWLYVLLKRWREERWELEGPVDEMQRRRRRSTLQKKGMYGTLTDSTVEKYDDAPHHASHAGHLPNENEHHKDALAEQALAISRRNTLPRRPVSEVTVDIPHSHDSDFTAPLLNTHHPDAYQQHFDSAYLPRAPAPSAESPPTATTVPTSPPPPFSSRDQHHRPSTLPADQQHHGQHREDGRGEQAQQQQREDQGDPVPHYRHVSGGKMFQERPFG